MNASSATGGIREHEPSNGFTISLRLFFFIKKFSLLLLFININIVARHRGEMRKRGVGGRKKNLFKRSVLMATRRATTAAAAATVAAAVVWRGSTRECLLSGNWQPFRSISIRIEYPHNLSSAPQSIISSSVPLVCLPACLPACPPTLFFFFFFFYPPILLHTQHSKVLPQLCPLVLSNSFSPPACSTINMTSAQFL